MLPTWWLRGLSSASCILMRNGLPRLADHGFLPDVLALAAAVRAGHASGLGAVDLDGGRSRGRGHADDDGHGCWPSVFLSGLRVPVDSMPVACQYIAKLVPRPVDDRCVATGVIPAWAGWAEIVAACPVAVWPGFGGDEWAERVALPASSLT